MCVCTCFLILSESDVSDFIQTPIRVEAHKLLSKYVCVCVFVMNVLSQYIDCKILCWDVNPSFQTCSNIMYIIVQVTTTIFRSYMGFTSKTCVEIPLDLTSPFDRPACCRCALIRKRLCALTRRTLRPQLPNAQSSSLWLLVVSTWHLCQLSDNRQFLEQIPSANNFVYIIEIIQL